MKKFIVLSLGLFFSLAAMSQAVVKFEKDSHDFGKIEKNGLANYDFVFTNTGDSALVISSVKASCGCTSPTWTKEPVQPGQSGVITVKYTTTSRVGTFNKSVTVNSNSRPDNVKRLNIRGEIIDSNATAAQ